MADRLHDLVRDSILQRPDEIEYIRDLIDEYDIRSVIEIGTYKGGTAAVYAAMGCSVVTIDSYDNQPKAWDSDEYKNEYPGADIKFIHGDSRSVSVIEQCPESVDLVVIDGGHDWATGLADLRNYGKRGAIIAIHDLELLGEEPFGDWFPIRFWKKLSNQDGPSVMIETHSGGDKGNWGVIFTGDDKSWIDKVHEW